MRVLINTPYLGGAGGLERLVRELCLALADDEIDIVYAESNGGELAEVGPGVTVRSRRALRYRGSDSANPAVRMLCRTLIDPVRRRLLSNYDLEIQLELGARVAGSVRAETRILNPCGSFLAIPGVFDLIWLESPSELQIRPDARPCTVLAPGVAGITDAPEPVEGLPERFLLTVFNPHTAVKGSDDLVRRIDAMPLPLVWCHSAATDDWPLPASLLDHPNIIHIVDGTHGQFRWLYEHARAYLCFSWVEAFGWAIADALVHSRAVISRPVGVLSYPESIDESVLLVDTDWDVDWTLLDSVTDRHAPRELRHLSSADFRARLLESCVGPGVGGTRSATSPGLLDEANDLS